MKLENASQAFSGALETVPVYNKGSGLAVKAGSPWLDRSVADVFSGSRSADLPVSSGKIVDVAKILREKMEAVAQTVGEYAANSGRSLNFLVDESADAVVIRVFNSNNGDLVRQIPSEEFLRIARHLDTVENFLLNIRV